MRHKAINNLYSTVTNQVNEKCYDVNGNPVEIDEDAVAVEEARLQSDFDAQEYARNRATAFPSIGDQLDMQYHDQLDGTTTWKDAIAKVKADNPKE